MVGYIVNVYTEMYLRVKMNPNITNGFRHLYQMIMDGRRFFRDDPAGWEIFLDRIEWNSYFLHYGNKGCRFYSVGVQNWENFCLKINIPKGIHFFIDEYQFRSTFFVIDIF